jgi:nucleotide-binding universal stress UspA family protein
MYKKILVPLDGSKLAEVVLPYAKELAGRLDLDVILLRVCEPIDSESECRSYVEQVAKALKKQSIDVQIRTGAPPQVNIEAHGVVLTGHPAEEILGYAENNDIDLMLLATHGRSGVRRWDLGGTADKAIRASKIPVWLVRANINEEIAHGELTNRTILVPLDGSTFAESVIPHVEMLAKQRGANLVNVVLLKIVEEPYINADYSAASMNLTWKEHVKLIREHTMQEAEMYLSGVQKRLAAGGLKVSSKVLMGNPIDEIIDFASLHYPNLVVLASHGYSWPSRWEYGNVTDKLARGISSPIIIVRPS